MNPEIGSTLREARVRRRLDLTEAEGATKIRVRYLRALENEEWDVLPGPTYTRSFIRTYATLLGLDGERLADDFRRLHEHAPLDRPRDTPVGGTAAAPAAAGGGGPGVSRGVIGALISIALIGVLVAIGLLGGDDNSPPAAKPVAPRSGGDGGGDGKTAGEPKQTGHELRLTALGEVWVCLLDGAGRPLVPGTILTAGTEEGPFRSGRFTVSFGNGEVEMTLDGERIPVEDTANPVGYRITSGGEVLSLAESERPTCT